MNLVIDPEISVTDIFASDKAAYLEHLQEKEIYDRTLTIPFPYKEKDVEGWFAYVARETKLQGRSLNWAIRKKGYLIGGIGFHDLELGKTHRAEFGYWLAKKFWNQGIATKVVQRISDFSFSELGLIRITAMVFENNLASSRVLEKAGFKLEGILKKHYRKDERIFDGRLYAKTKED